MIFHTAALGVILSISYVMLLTIYSYDTDRTDIFSQRNNFLSTSSSQEMKKATETLIEANAAAYGVPVSESMKWILDNNIY